MLSHSRLSDKSYWRADNMWVDRWVGLASAMAIQACGYTYAVYSEHMKEVMEFTQEQVDDIGAAKDLGRSLSIVGGLLYNSYPPFVTVSIGAVLLLAGYMALLHRPVVMLKRHLTGGQNETYRAPEEFKIVEYSNSEVSEGNSMLHRVGQVTTRLVLLATVAAYCCLSSRRA